MKATLSVLKHKQFWGCVAALALTGCAHNRSAQLGPEHDPSRACLNALAADPVIQPLSARLGPFGGSAPAPSLEMRASKDLVADEERPLLSHWALRRQACHDEGVSFRLANAPAFYRAAIDTQTASLLGLMAKLYARDINYGQFIAERDRLAAETRQAISTGAVQHEQAETQRRQADAARGLAFMQAVQASQPAPIVYQPVPVPPVPRTINCTTMPMGAGWTNTRCQ